MPPPVVTEVPLIGNVVVQYWNGQIIGIRIVPEKAISEMTDEEIAALLSDRTQYANLLKEMEDFESRMEREQWRLWFEATYDGPEEKEWSIRGGLSGGFQGPPPPRYGDPPDFSGGTGME